LLKLKRLQILGFKSFCDRTELKFHGDGIAAIIGPNGCGKSNIADSISWVLGEQSAKTLRGSCMEDVIFAGTRDRKPTGMAEVSLTLIDPEAYDGADADEPTAVEIQDEMPAGEMTDDWDEAEIRAHASAETERLTEEARPGRTEDSDKPQNSGNVLSEVYPEDEPRFAIVIPIDSAFLKADPDRVVLKIRRRKFQQQVPTGEIIVTRRLFRSGDSEYLLNGKLCRLRDIQELFMGTGLGPESYALIEQGRIGQILSSRPTDRRAIIEEAAGITKFKTKKRLAEARLEDSKQNLARVNDIFDEVTRQMNSLKRQASKAERYARLRDEMRAKLRVVLASKFVNLDQESAALDEQMNTLGEEMRQQAETLQQLESEQADRRQRGYAIESESRTNRERLNEIKLEVEAAQTERRHNEERRVELVSRSASFEAELAQSRQRVIALESERDSNRRILESAVADVAAAQQELAASRAELAAVSDSVAISEQEQEQTRLAILEAVASAADYRNHITQAQERWAGMNRETQRLQGEMSAAASHAEAFDGKRGQLVLEFETVSQRVGGLTEELMQAHRALESKRHEETEGKSRLDQLRAEYASAVGRKSSLDALITEHGYSTESVRRLFQSGGLQGGLAPAGVLADFLEVDPRYEAVVEDFLRDELNFVVVKSWDAADEGLRLLRAGVDGRATFLVHPEDSQAKFSFAAPENGGGAANESIIPLKSTIRVLNGFGKSLEVILSKLRDGYIVADPAFARDLALENPDAFFLSQSGECFHNVTVTGGKQRSEGPLSLKRELRDTLRLVGELEQALRQEELRVLTVGKEIRDLASLLDRLEQEKREAERQAMTSGHMLQQLDSEMARTAESVEICGQELQRLQVEGEELQKVLEVCQAQLTVAEQHRTELEQKLARAQEQFAALRIYREQASKRVSEFLAQAAALEERHRAAVSGLERISSLLEEAAKRGDSIGSQIEAAFAEKATREIENQQLADRLVELAAERNACETRDSLLQFESEQVRARLAELDSSLRDVRQLLDQARDRRADLSAASAKLQSDQQYLAQTCLDELGLERPALLADSTLPVVAGEQLALEDQLYREMRTRLDAMGPVNMMALEEYKEIAERHAFLENQRKDLCDSIENTLATIREIDIFSRQKFAEAFARINENFQATFRKLFGGGHGFMRLTDEENAAESGIDVVASPPGKKLQNVLLLSGGEKALTALALLVGIFQFQPSPFCILDEVDAPLDEANIGRFTELVKEMSLQTQFVLITHSKKTMSIAPVLYGVTMQEPGVSKLVSVKLGATA